ncbi:hypothetical protein DSTSK_02850 [Desulforhabdus sp. TSK]|nr:hypothetical protein DSTSK_02850 [Desulforhabdus sp. TSK]
MGGVVFRANNCGIAGFSMGERKADASPGEKNGLPFGNAGV